MAKLSISGLLLGTLVLGLAWTWNSRAVHAQNPAPGLNFTISVAGVPGCETTNGDKTCVIAVGSAFTLNFNLNHLPNGVARYLGYDADLTYSGVQPQGDPNTDAWPDCAFPATGPAQGGNLTFACATGVPPAGPSSYTGTIATVAFTCAQPGSIVLNNGDGQTDLDNESNELLYEATATETLTINCSSGPGAVTPVPAGTTASGPTATRLPPTEEAQVTATAKAAATATAKTGAATPTPTGGTTGGKGGGGGIPSWAIALIVVGAIVGLGGGGYAGWRYWQSRTPTGGAT